MTATPATLTLQDIADLAHVKRPVVSMWRRRTSSRGVEVPFPKPVLESAGTEHFDRAEIEDYLAQTGRGNNAEFALDAAAHAVPAGTELEELVTLLSLRVLTGEELADTTSTRRTAMARGVDATDDLLLGEIEAMSPRADTLKYVDDLFASAYGGADALDRLESGRLTRERAARDLTEGAQELVATVVRTCLGHEDLGEATLRLDNDRGLPLTLAAGFAAVEVTGSSAQDRALRRRATIREIALAGGDRVRRVHALSVLDEHAESALDRVDTAVLDLDAGDIAVIVGAASLLCDALPKELERSRAETLRPGGLALALRLPRGLWREAHRQSLGLWVCAGGTRNERPFVADLSGQPLSEVQLEALAADLTAALTDAGGRSFQYARAVELPRVLAGGPVVPRGIRALRLGTSADTTYVDQVHAATLETTRSLTPFDVLVAPKPGAVLVQERSLGQLRDGNHLALKRGNRVDPEHADPNGSVLVLPQEQTNNLKLDAIDAHRFYPRATRTEPGDVVFVEKPHPRSWIDEQGGNLVATPARILRLKATAALGPHVLAAAINDLAREGSEWETWGIPDLPRDEIAALEEALAGASRYRAEALARAEAATSLTTSLIKGVAASALTLIPPDTPMMIPTHHKEAS